MTGLPRYLFFVLLYLNVKAQPDSETNCHTRMGVATAGEVPLYWLFGSDGHAHLGRLDQPQAWISYLQPYTEETKDRFYAWIQVDLQRETLVTGILTQGDPEDDNWVKMYSVWKSDDCETFLPTTDVEGHMAQYHGNYDRDDVVTNILPSVLVTRCVRIVPLEISGNYTSMRLELLGCDVAVCREEVITHLANEFVDNSSQSANMSDFLPTSRSPLPTLVSRGFAEFKFPAEQVAFGVVFYVRAFIPGKKMRTERVIIMYSRNCHSWDPVREKQGFGDPMVFPVTASNYRSVWHAFPYPVRAQCVRIIPITTRFTITAHPRAHFIGCGVWNKCGRQKPIRRRRVVGGEPSDVGWWPWLASLRIRYPDEEGYSHLCGATLIHPQYLITAAHCITVIYTNIVQNVTFDFTQWNREEVLNNIVVRMGEHSLTLPEDTQIDMKVEEIIGHEDYNISHYINDIALIKLARPLRLSDYVNTICLPESVSSFAAGDTCEVIGWGSTGEEMPARPHHVAVPLVSDDACQKMYSHLVITPDMQCAAPEEGGNDACNGDSGGPLVCERDDQWYLVGIVSWNIGCGRQGYPGVYAKVAYFLDWINDLIHSL